MPSHYSVIQFVPDPVADERINIGVIAYDATSFFVRFVDQWERVRRFAHSDVAFLQEVARHMSSKTTDLFAYRERLGPQLFDSRNSDWPSTLQVTTPSASMKSASELLQYAADRFLFEPMTRERLAPDRRTVAQVARSYIRTSVTKLVGSRSEALVRTNYKLKGKLIPHKFDTVVQNGRPYFAAHALSFQSLELRSVSTQADAIAWMIRDVRDTPDGDDLPIAVVVLAPDPSDSNADRMDLFSESRRVVLGLGAEMLAPDEVQQWADGVGKKRIPESQQLSMPS